MCRYVPVSCPDAYDFVFRKYRSFLFGVVYHCGVPVYLVEEACDEILLRMLAQDGLAKFIGSLDNPRQIKAYLASYFSLGARAEISRFRSHASRFLNLDALPDLAYSPAEDAAESRLLDDLLDLTDGDVHYFIVIASQYPTYPKAREALVEEGWDSLRIRRAVKVARATARGHLCSAS